MEKMKAVRVHNYGGPEVLRFEDAPRPMLSCSPFGTSPWEIQSLGYGIEPSAWLYAGTGSAGTCLGVFGTNGSSSDLKRGFKRSSSLSRSNSFLGSVEVFSA